MTELETVQEDTDLLNNWSQEVQLYCILKIYLTYGVMRPSEIVDCLICNCDGDDTTNYINVNTKQIVINNHKNDRKGKKVIDISSDKKLLGILRKVIGQFLVTNQQGELYQSSSAFTKMFKSHFNDYTPYDLRKAISSKYIAEGDVEKIKKLEHNQSHSLQVILDNYNVYTKSS
jgi:integrase